MNNKIIPVFVSHQGCPHTCVFCNQRKITSQKQKLNKEEITKYIDKYIVFFSDKSDLQIAFFGGSFTAIDRDLMVDYLDIAYSYIKKGLVKDIRLSTRPDAINREILDILKKYDVKVIELGVQSMDEEVLKYNERGHGVEEVYESSKLIKEYGFTLGLQMMTNLYKDTFEKDILTAKKIGEINPDFVRIYPTLTIKNTKLSYLYEKGLYHPNTLEESLKETLEIYKIFINKDIPVIRIGLQPTDELSSEGNVIAGPYHSSYRSFLESILYREKIDKMLENKKDFSQLIIFANKKDISDIVGNKGINKKYFIEKYKLNKISFIEDDLEEKEIRLEILG